MFDNILNELNTFEDLENIPLPEFSKDEELLKKMIDDIAKYDIYDFISRVSSLNLLIENQNKSIVFDALIAALLLRKRETYVGTYPMSGGKFEQVITQLTNLTLFQMIDPAENAFIERVRYYGNYWIFPGINFSPSFCLQGFLDFLCLRKPDLCSAFVDEAHQLINFVLQVSDLAANKLGYNIETIQHIETKSINIPNSLQSNLLKSCVRLDYSLIEKLIPSLSLREKLFIDFTESSISKVLEGNWQDFFAHPFLKALDNTVIVLNPSILVSFAIHQIIVLAEKYGVNEQLILGYNNEIWNQCRSDIKRLGHRKIDEKAYGIELINNESFKEEILTVGNDKVLFLYYLCDSGENYKQDSMFDIIDITKNVPISNERNQYLISNLPNCDSSNAYYVIIINSFGRTIEGTFNIKKLKNSINITPFELHCISINESQRVNFIPNYINAKSHIISALPSALSTELNSIEIYTQNDYSFYLSDDIDTATTQIYFGLGDSLDYIIRALLNENRHLLDYYDGTHFADVTLSDSVRNIYLSKQNKNKCPELVVKFNDIVIWLTAEEITCLEEVQINSTLLDALSYWLAESKSIINKMCFKEKTFRFNLHVLGTPQDYFKAGNLLPKFLDGIKYNAADTTIEMTWSPSAYRFLGSDTNDVEKELLISLLRELESFSTIPADLTKIDELFQNPLKKKVFEIDTVKYPFAIPIAGEMQIVSTEDENMLLNEIGEHFLKMPEYDYGRVPNEKRAELANRVVGYLYSILKNELSSINPNGLFERVCFDLETVMYRVMISQMRYAYDISCYPEKANMIFSEYNEANKSSVALKFLAEYIAAVPPVGQKSLGEMQYNRLLAICHLIIEWAYKNDSFVYNIVNTPIDFLKSGRIGMPKDNDEYLANINASARIRHLNSLSNPNFSSYSPTRLFNDYEQELDEAFIDEYGFSFQQFIKCILTIGIYGESMTGEVKKSSRQALIEAVHNDSGIDKQIIDKIVNQITLSQRTDFLVPPSPFEKYDVYPWRFNRELSFTRRPITQYKNELIWGNRQLHHMWRYAIDLLMEGKYKARNKKLKQLLGKISDKRGNDFNTAVYTKLASYEEFIVKERVAKINGKKISDFNGNVLGDIDILCIIPKRHKIIVGEVKDFSFAKNPYEMQMEYKKIFIDDKKPCYITKHKRRVSWIKDHIDDVLLQFNLKKGKWSVEMALFVSEEIVSNQFFHKNENVIVYSDITEALIESI